MTAPKPARRRSIGLVHCRYLQPGGEDRVVADEAAFLRDAGHEVRLAEVSNVRLRDAAMAATRPGSGLREVTKALAGAPLDLLHVHNTHVRIGPRIYGWAASRGLPTVTTLHNYRWFCVAATFYRDGGVCTDCVEAESRLPGIRHACFRGSRIASAVVSRASAANVAATRRSETDHLIALSRFQRDFLVGQGFDESQVHVVHNAIADPGKPKGGGRSRQALYVGRLSEEKGIVPLAKAWAASGTEVPLAIVGTGPAEAELQRIAAESPAVRLLGHVDAARLAAERATAAVQVIPSRWFEGSPLVLVEALAAGLPLVVPRLGAMPEALVGEAGTAGTVVEPADAPAMIEAALAIVDQPATAAAYGKAGRAIYEARHRPDQHVKQLEAVYAALLEE
jgi:glycosyltransferase involved in cell wall biosynthesis